MIKKFDKRYTVQGSAQEYDVHIVSDGETVKAHCSCQAGQFKTLCKHVMQCVGDDDEVRYAMAQCGYLQVYEEYEQRLAYAEQVKREVKNIKKKFERLFLE